IIPLQVTQGLHVGYATQLREAYKMPATLSLKSETGTDRFYIIPSRSQLPSGECEDRPMVVSGNSNKPSLKNHRVPQAITADVKPALMQNAVAIGRYNSDEAIAHVVQLRYRPAKQHGAIAGYDLVVMDQNILADAAAPVFVAHRPRFSGNDLPSGGIHESKSLVAYKRSKNSRVQP